ncbi:MAG: hypothetical protein OXI01_00960 [Albidovulum sp.]|nr:hypothetical protein [Albidovulum sp.]
MRRLSPTAPTGEPQGCRASLCSASCFQAYTLVAIGLNLQCGIARTKNLANGEFLVLGALASFWPFITSQISPKLTVMLIALASYVGNRLAFRFLLLPLVGRSKTRGQLEVDSILAAISARRACAR